MNKSTVTVELPPPSDIDRERVVLGAFIQQPERIADYGYLSAEDFHFQHHQWIYEALQAEPTSDYRVLADRIGEKLDTVGGWQYIVNLTIDVPYALDLTEHIRKLKDYAARRGLMYLMQKMGAGIANNPDVQEVIAEADAGINAIVDGRMQAYDTTRTARDIASSLTDYILEWQSNPQDVRGYRTGLTDLDRTLSGIPPRKLVYVCARPGIGKSALLADIGRRHALDGGAVLIFALEMTAEDMMKRMACQIAKVDSHRAKTGKLSQPEYTRLHMAIDQLAKCNLWIEDQPGLSIAEMQAIARRYERKQPLTMVMVDTMNLVKSAGKSPYERMTAASRAAKDWAHGSQYALICATQLSRANERQASKAPTLDAIRDSGAIEEDGDIILGLHRAGAYLWDDPELEHQAEILILKNRDGEAFKKIKLYWNAVWPGFENAATNHVELDDLDLTPRTVYGRDHD